MQSSAILLDTFFLNVKLLKIRHFIRSVQNCLAATADFEREIKYFILDSHILTSLWKCAKSWDQYSNGRTYLYNWALIQTITLQGKMQYLVFILCRRKQQQRSESTPHLWKLITRVAWQTSLVFLNMTETLQWDYFRTCTKMMLTSQIHSERYPVFLLTTAQRRFPPHSKR